MMSKMELSSISRKQYDTVLGSMCSTGKSARMHPVLCDSCDGFVAGRRFKCLNCEDFDFCERCMEVDVVPHDEGHCFVSLCRPVSEGEVTRVVPRGLPGKGEEVCVDCDVNLEPPYFNCVACSTGPRCAPCRTRTCTIAQTHDLGSVVWRQPPGHLSDTSFHTHSICDGCDERILTTCFRCTSCPDYDLCPACLPDAPHDPSHAFISKRIGSLQLPCMDCTAPLTGLYYTCNSCKTGPRCSSCRTKPCPSSIGTTHGTTSILWRDRPKDMPFVEFKQREAAMGVASNVIAQPVTEGTFVREAEEEDLTQVAELDQCCFPSDPFPLQYFEEALGHKDAGVYVAFSLHAPQIVLGAGMYHKENDTTAHLSSLCVSPQARKMGIGSSLITAITTHAFTTEHHTSVILHVSSGNDAAIKLYRKHGFEECTVIPQYYQSSSEDAFYMRLPLETWRETHATSTPN